jgi:hypothetical protein
MTAFILLIAFAGSALGQVAGIPELVDSNFVDLTVERPKVSMKISYPGFLGESRCAIEFNANFKLPSGLAPWALVKEIKVTDRGKEMEPEENDGRSLVYKLKSLGSFVTWIEVETRSGKTLKAVIEETFSQNLQKESGASPPQVIVVTRPCK